MSVKLLSVDYPINVKNTWLGHFLYHIDYWIFGEALLQIEKFLFKLLFQKGGFNS